MIPAPPEPAVREPSPQHHPVTEAAPESPTRRRTRAPPAWTPFELLSWCCSRETIRWLRNKRWSYWFTSFIVYGIIGAIILKCRNEAKEQYKQPAMSDLLANTPISVLSNAPMSTRAHRALSATLRWNGELRQALDVSLNSFEWDEDGHYLWGYHHEVEELC